MIKTYTTSLIFSLFLTNYLIAQVSISTDNSLPDASAMLDVQSSTKGMLVPRLTTAQRAAVASPAKGLLVFDSDSASFWFYDGSSWTELLASAEDADADPANELQTLSFTSPNLNISNGNSVNLSQLADGTGTDDQELSLSGTSLSIEDGNSVELSSLTDDGDWVVSSGTNITNGNDGNVGIGNLASTQNRWQLTVKDTTNAMLNSDSIDVSELFAVFTRNINENNVGIGIGFQSTSTVTGIGAAIVHERTSSNSRGKLHFSTKSSSSAAAEDLPINMTISENGNLGIGTTSPSEKLHLNGGDILADRGTTSTGLSRILTLEGARTGDSPFGRIDFDNYDNDSGSAYTGASIRANNGGDAIDNGDLRFLTYDGTLSERMRISEGGFVGIGETSPQTSLDVVDKAVIGNIDIGIESTDQSTSVAASAGYTTTPWLYTNALEAQSERGSASTLITLGADGTYGTGDEIHFVTSGNSQMRISSDGKLGIDKDPDTDIHIRQSQQSITNGTGGIKYEDGSDATDYWRTYHSGIFYSFNLQGNRVAYVNTNGAWTVDSDRSLKKQITNLEPTLGKVMKMRPVQYRYKEQDNEAMPSLGFIAQEVQPLFPQMVVEGEDGKLGMTYSYAGVIAIKAIQEQQEVIESYEERLEKLEKELAELKALLAK